MQTAAAEGKAQTEAALAVMQESLNTAEADRTQLAAQVEDLQTQLAAAASNGGRGHHQGRRRRGSRRQR